MRASNLYELEKALNASLKKFITLFKENSPLDDYEYKSVIEKAIEMNKSEHLKYILFGSLHSSYSSNMSEEQVSGLVAAIKLQGYAVFGIEGLASKVARSDNPEILNQLRVLNYELSDLPALKEYIQYNSLNIISFLLKERTIRPSDILEIDKIELLGSFELFVLLNTVKRVTIPATGTYYDYQDGRKRIFEEGNFDRFTVDNIQKSIINLDHEEIIEVIDKVTADAVQQNDCLADAIQSKSKFILSLLFNNGYRPINLRTFIDQVNLYGQDAGFEMMKLVFKTFSDEVRVLIKENPDDFVVSLLKCDRRIQFLFQEGFLIPSNELMYTIMNLCKPDKSKETVVSLYALNFPVHTMDYSMITSPTTRERIRPLIAYFNELQQQGKS